MDLDTDTIVTAALAGEDEAAWPALCGALVLGHTDGELEATAERIKSHAFDRLLHDNLDQAERVAAFLCALGTRADLPRILGLGLLAQGDAARQRGHARTAMDLFQRSADVFLGAGARVGWARARGGWLLSASQAGCVTLSDLAGMDDVARALRDEGYLYRLANFEQNRGIAYDSLLRPDEAQDAYDRALALLDMLEAGAPSVEGSAPSHWARLRGMLLSNKAAASHLQGNLQETYELRIQARALFEQLDAPINVAIENVTLAGIERQRFHMRAALTLVGSAIEGERAANQLSLLASALMFRADTLLALNRADDAAGDAAEAVSILRRLENPVDLADALGVEAAALAQRGQDQFALERLVEAEEIMRDRPLRAHFHPRLRRAALLLSRGRAAEAFALVSDHAATLAATSRDHQLADLLAAEAALALHRLDEARARVETLLREQEAALAEEPVPEVVYRGQVVLARAAALEGDVADALDHYDTVAATLLRVADDLAYDQSAQFLEDKDDYYLEALSLAVSGGNAARALRYLEQARARARWQMIAGQDDELEALRARHRHQSATLAALPADSPRQSALQEDLRLLDRQIRERTEALASRQAAAESLSAEELMQMVPPGETALAYAVTRDDLFIFVLTHGDITAHRVTGGARSLRTRDRLLHLRLDTFAPSRENGAGGAFENDVQQELRALWGLLVAPVASMLPPDGAPLTIVPHGLLHALPLPALHDGERYLAERWAVRCVSSCQVLASGSHPREGEAAMKASAKPAAAALLALGYSNGDLPHVEREAGEIAALLGGRAHVGREATGERLRAEAQTAAYLHIAAHGALRLDVPNSSYVELADGPFHPSDVVSLALGDCRLVTLSACRTGLGRPSGGDERIGLVRAFDLAGAHAVLATLWRIDDAASRTFMTHFYERLAAGAPPAQALRAAQLAFISGDHGDELRHPYYWAGFHLVEHVLAPAGVTSPAEVEAPATMSR